MAWWNGDGRFLGYLKRLGFQRTGSDWNGEDEHVMLVLSELGAAA